MRKLKRSVRGQFVIVAALLIAVLTLSLATTIHQTNLHRQEMRYRPVQELVLSITSDLERALAHSLSRASERYFKNTLDIGGAAKEGNSFLAEWGQSVIASYSSTGLNLSTIVRPDSFRFNESWFGNPGRSIVYADFKLDAETYGFRGWEGHSAKYVTLLINPDSTDLTSPEKTLTFQVKQSALGEEQGVPVSSLTTKSLIVRTIVTENVTSSVNILSLNYLGDGNYTATFKPIISERTIGVVLTVITPEDGIYVCASYRYEDVAVTFQSQEENSPVPTNLGHIRFEEWPESASWSLPYSKDTQPGKWSIMYLPETMSHRFLNWTTTDDISIENPASPLTKVTILGNGTITAFYNVVEPVSVDLTLDSREWDYSTRHLGRIMLNSTSYSLPETVVTQVSDNFIIEYVSDNPTYTFWQWEASPNIMPSNYSAQRTSMTVLGTGNLTAIYRVKLPEPFSCTVNLLSLEETLETENLGQIRFAENLYELPSSMGLNNGNYLLEYIPLTGYTFTYWATTGNVTVDDSLAPLTQARINGNGTIIAYYKHSPPPVPITVELISEEENGLTSNLGWITLGEENRSLPATTTLEVGDYVLVFTPESDYVFIRWEFSDSVIVWDTTKDTTMVSVYGSGTIVAVYGSEAPNRFFVSLDFFSKDEFSASANLGKIQFRSEVLDLPANRIVPYGTYLLKYIPLQGYTFVGWTVSGNVLVQDLWSPLTSVTANGDGTITAVYRGCNILLDSRELDDTSSNLGQIALSSTSYVLPAYLQSLAAGSYAIEYTPPNSTIVFLWWETTGAAIVSNSNGDKTTVMISGDGTVTAVYTYNPPLPVKATIAFQSTEETLASQNLGNIQLGPDLFMLPNSTEVFSSTYLLEYIPLQGYTFVNWTTSGNVFVQDLRSQTTSVTVNGNGAITAFYRGCKIQLTSKEWNSTLQNRGQIALGSTMYSLPKYLTGLPASDYPIQYTPYNSSYAFLWWEYSGDVIVWGAASSTAILTIYGDGTVTAVYIRVSEPPPPPPVGKWNVLYVDLKYKLVPGFMWSGRDGHEPSRASTGKDKQEAILTSPQTPTLYLAKILNVTAWIRPVPPNSAKDVYLELGFNYNGQYYKLGDGTFLANSLGMYGLNIDIEHGSFTEEYGVGVIPQGSTIILKIIVTFYVPPNGFFFLYYGPSNPSRVELF